MPTLLELYEKLKPTLGEEEARALLEYIEASVERKAATKEDLQRTELTLREELRRVDQALREELRRIDQALHEELHGLDQKIEVAKADLIKWTFGFWVGNVAVLSGIMFALLRTFGGK